MKMAIQHSARNFRDVIHRVKPMKKSLTISGMPSASISMIASSRARRPPGSAHQLNDRGCHGMSEKLPQVPASRIFTLLKRKGFTCVRQSGNHKIFKNDSGTRVTVPDHAGKILHPKIVKQICKDADINPDELA